MNLKDKIVVITGAGSGIGAATAKLFAKEGASVIISDINANNANIIKEDINSNGGTAEAIISDVSKFEEVESLINKTIDTFGKIDVMVNNAGIANKKMQKTAEHDVDDWHRVISVNQHGVFYGMKLALQQMMKQGYGNIVNVASLAGLKASGKNLAYSASKFAVVGMTKSAALEYASKNIRINCVCPGYTRTDLVNNVFNEYPHMHDTLLNMIPMKRYGQPEETANAILWLASDQSSFMTGQAITLDGGLSL